MLNVKEWRRTPSFPRFEEYMIPWYVLPTLGGLSSTLGDNWFWDREKIRECEDWHPPSASKMEQRCVLEGNGPTYNRGLTISP